MIDQKLLRDNPKLILEGLRSRGMDIDLGPLQKFCQDLRELEEKRSSFQAQGNSIGKEVGQKMGISQERVRHLETRALCRMRHPERRKILGEYTQLGKCL